MHLVDVMTMIDDDTILERFSLPKGSMQLVDKAKSELVKTETAELRKNSGFRRISCKYNPWPGNDWR